MTKPEDGSIQGGLQGLLLRQERELTQLTAANVETEDKYYAHIESSDYNALEAQQKSSYTWKKNELQAAHGSALTEVEGAYRRVNATKALLGTSNVQGSSSRESGSSTKEFHVRVPTVP